MDKPREYELLMAVFSACDPREGNRKLAVIKYIRLMKPTSREEAIRVLEPQLMKKYTGVEFEFWCDTWTSDSGGPQEISRLAQTVRLFIGTQPEPGERFQIEVSLDDSLKIPPRGSCTRRAVTVTDLITGKPVTVRRASCGLPRCFCALKLAGISKERKPR